MKKTEIFKIITFYIKARLKGVIFLILSCLTFVIVFSLYNLPVEPVAYASILCISIGFLFLIVDFFYFYKKHKLLQELKDNIILNFDNLPEAKDLIEKDYYDLLTIT